ncbi:hypothetical protein DFP72DRAFT_503438 [Ephemerocybe angulata]|uniref:Uncharacterized protein n=1 Tax=Ephemerocybe angulata TaxID=980116 RepID=A0A8H6HRI6_9AGAR|nr:hypothetical protein DFP72DRAFT_503438 [Tulosesus angulatus]
MRTVMIAVGVVIGILSLLSIPLIIMFCHRRRQRAKDEAAKMNFSVDPEPQKTFDSGYKSHPSIEINVSGPVNVHNSAAAPHHHISTSPTRPAYVNFNAAQRYPGGYAPAPASRQATTGHGPAHSQGYGSRDALTRDLERVGQDYTHLKNREHANRSGVLPSSRPIQSPRVPNSPPTSPQITHGQSLGPLMVSNAASNDGHSSPEPGASAPLEQHERARRQDSVDSQASTASGATIGTITDGYGTGLGARGFKLTIPLSRESKAWEAAMDREVEEMEAPPYKARNTLPPAYPGLSHDLPGAPLPSTSVLPPTPPAYSQSSATPVPAVSLSRAPRPKRSGLTQVRKAAEQARTLDDSRRAGMLTRGDANRSVTVAPKRETRIATLYNPWDEARHAEDARASGTFEGTTLVDSAPIRGLKSELVVLSPSRG